MSDQTQNLPVETENTEKFDREGFERLQKMSKEYEAHLRERLGKFNIDEVLRQARDLRCCFIEGLGEVKYVILTEQQGASIASKYKDDLREANLHGLATAMGAADPEITVEKLRQLPYDVVRVLTEKILNDGFLPQKTLKPGSTAAANFKA